MSVTPHLKQRQGFTIIEVLIVLAIAGVFMLMVFLVIPALQRNSRNYQRKNAADYVLTQMNDYYTNYNHYPLAGSTANADDRTAFVNDLRSQGPTMNFDIRYADNEQSHEYPYDTGQVSQALQQVSIMPGHQCNRKPGAKPGSPDYPVETSPGGDSDYGFFAIWIPLENNAAYCLDNQN